MLQLTIRIGNINQQGYRSYYFDQETGLYYLNARYYSPEFGRFINADELLESGHEVLGNNLYAYCSNNPVMGYDPTGTFSFWDVLDVGSWIDSAYQMIKKPSLGNLGWLALDTVGLLPLAPGAGTIKAGSKIVSGADKVKDTTKAVNKAADLGKKGEKSVGVALNLTKNTTKIPMNGRNRIPDFIKGTKIIEVKNVKTLSYTSQLRDYYKYAGLGNMDLYVRQGTKISGPLQDSGINIIRWTFD